MKLFSLVIPAYKHEKTIGRDVREIVKILDTAGVPFEVIVVVDGYHDGTKIEAEKVGDPRIRVVGYPTNHGKGYAVRYGFSHANGDVVGFMDGGGDLKPSALPLMITQFEFQEADVVIGSKRHPDSKVSYPTWRRIQSWVYQKLVHLLFGLDVRDTQVGMKIYRRKVLEDVLPRLLVKQFAFDIEILVVARHLGYTKIYEAPVELDFAGAVSSITFRKLARVVFRTFIDTLAIFYRLRILRYYDSTNKRIWRYDPELNFRVNIG
jgi:glycosyltransferase involved in cell wall biosynthesis